MRPCSVRYGRTQQWKRARYAYIVSRLRRALAAEDDQTVYIVNEAGRGYRFAAAISVETAPDPLAPVPRPVSHGLPLRLGQIHGRSKNH